MLRHGKWKKTAFKYLGSNTEVWSAGADQTMPRMTGTELSRELLQIRPDIPVILCTGLGAAAEKAQLKEEAEQAGIRELALKPLDREEFASTIRRVLAARAQG